MTQLKSGNSGEAFATLMGRAGQRNGPCVLPQGAGLRRRRSSYIESLQQSGPLTKTLWGIEAMGLLQMGILLGDSPVGNVI
ncbi:hypothetical protein DL766_008109 [Monosporascus sp. MC13-8B]|uniref:Uncharacterized protein n=1 Tax=Monosporascus cannonballus TaxID=155416 RepID=A0ABY0GVY4_9PEZI|nr:hypothetical protein DL762_008635 [Monosporascus cannonballus]RYO84996.1 hypothetical protein DL763_007257 [Monosporascus cannonballus]RYP20764.1 hypothetical protein DL766_008109 [Monosporascus sp. MC13-8B]